MNDATFIARLEEARQKIESLPADQQASLKALLEETRERHQSLKESFTGLHQDLEDWRLNMKYVAFDLEATRRELADLRKRMQDDK